MFKKLLVPLDGSPLAEEAIGCAAGIARATNASVDLALVHEMFPFAAFNEPPWSMETSASEDGYLADVAKELATGAGVAATHTVLRGDIADVIANRAREIDADLIVMTSHGRTGLSRAWIGSTAQSLLRRSPVPVIVLRPVKTGTDRRAAHALFKHVLVTLDGSAMALDVIPAAVSLARACKAKLSLVRVVQPVPLTTLSMGVPYVYPAPIPDDSLTERVADEAKQDLADVARGIAAHGFEVDSHVVVDPHVAGSIIDFARANGVDAIATATHGRGASRLLLGSVADKLLRASGLPMLMFRPIDVTAEPVLEDAVAALGAR